VHGTTVSAFTFISWNPTLVSICLCPGTLLDLLIRQGCFAVNVLSSGQANLARQFSDPRRKAGLGQFETVPWVPAADGRSPLLLGAVCWLDCRYLRHETLGDHEFVLAEVLSATESETAPLLYFGGNLYPAVIQQEVPS
jgi:flavin reductase (DIM6/NTAB) family NADH-FMN oxidoreductase RutF